MIYTPREDSYLLEKEVKKYSKGKRVLDMGTGSGIQAIAAKYFGAKSVIACDIADDAVKQLGLLGIKTIKSDLFSEINGKFDLIVFNPPYLPEDRRENGESALATTVGIKGDEIILRFLEQVKEHLSERGIILLLVSSLTPKDRIKPAMKEKGFNKKVITSEKVFFETLEVWEIKVGD